MSPINARRSIKKVPGEISAKFKNLQKIKRLLDIPKENRYCEQCGSDMVRVGEEFVRNELKFTPPKLELVKVYRATYEYRNCRKHGKPNMIKAEVPANVIPHSYASADSAAIYSIVETAKANKIDPYKYLNFLFHSLPGLDFISEPSLLEDDLPWNSEIQTICK